MYGGVAAKKDPIVDSKDNAPPSLTNQEHKGCYKPSVNSVSFVECRWQRLVIFFNFFLSAPHFLLIVKTRELT